MEILPPYTGFNPHRFKKTVYVAIERKEVEDKVWRL
jgi:hypothetical protein